MWKHLASNRNDTLPDGTPIKRFYAFQEMCLRYFWPDWWEEDPSPDSVLKQFRSEDPDAAAEAADEIAELLALGLPEPTFKSHILQRYDLHYDPAEDGWTMSTWLCHVQELLLESP